MEKEKFVIKKTLGAKFMRLLVISVIILTVAVCIAVAMGFVERIMERFVYTGFSVTDYVASNIDGDSIKKYLSTGETDDEYEVVRADLENTLNQFDLIYLYVAVPEDGHMTYVWEATSGAELIGYEDAYSPGGEDWSKAVMEGIGEKKLRTFYDPQFGSVATAASRIYDSNGNAVALAYADFSLQAIRNGIFSMIIRTIVILLVLMLLFSIAFYYISKKSIVDPIRDLTVASDEIIENIEDENAAFSSTIHTGDEVEALSRSFEDMVERLRNYIKENESITAEKERIGTELSIATSIQTGMLPSIFPDFVDREEYEMFASMDTAKEVGGDFYDFFNIDDDHLAIVMADVSGKGVPAALFMMISKIIIKNRTLQGGTPAEILAYANDQLCSNNPNNMFVTVWLGILTLSTGEIIAANAGHENPILTNEEGQYEMYTDPHGLVLGAMGGMAYTDYTFQIPVGGKLYVYTDGVAEAHNISDELFGDERILDTLNSCIEKQPEDIVHTMRKAIDDFAGEKEQFDDITMLSFWYKGKK